MELELDEQRALRKQDRGRPKFLAWLEYAYLLRFPIVAALLLAIVLPVSFFAIPSIFVGLFDARGKWSLAFVVWIALNLAWSVMTTSRLVLAYARDRFTELPEIKLKTISFGVTLAFAVLALPCVALTWYGSEEIALAGKAVGLLVGTAAAVAMLFAAAAVHFKLEPAGGETAAKVVPSFGFMKSTGSVRLMSAGPVAQLVDSWQGVFDGVVEGRRLRSGHAAAGVRLGMLLFVYVVMGVAFYPAYVAAHNQPAALFYALFLITLLTWLLSGVAFFLDRFRIPVLTTLLVLSLLTGTIHTDHTFRVYRGEAKAPVADVGPVNVVEQWSQKRGGSNKPIVVVATAGGGIQAAAWTARVLTKVEENCGEKFSSSLLLVSSVSGGSAGTMYFLAEYDGKQGNFPDDQKTLNDVWSNASRSSLSPVGWGLLYPDFLRTVPAFGSLVPEAFDRGWALENAWITGWKQPPDMSEWRADVARGTRPAVIFNATAAESGQRFVIASTDTKEDSGVVQFFRAYSGWDMPVATAARLSAAFTFVSPIARASGHGASLPKLHLADGGYYDNSGVLSAVDWLEQAADELPGHPVVLLTIDGSAPQPRSGQSWSWQRQITAPLETVIRVRTSSQLYRDSLESRLAAGSLKGKSVVLYPVPFNFPGDIQTPLSWHLTPSQQDQIKDGWNAPSLADSKDRLGKILGCAISK